MKEDDLAIKIIQQQKNRKNNRKSAINDLWIEPEAHYNHFGNRGSLDLFIKSFHETLENDWFEHELYELKSELNNANKVIRQANRHKKYFYKDDSRQKPRSEIHRPQIKWYLVILANRSNYKHIIEYYDMYETLKQNNWKIYFGHPDIEARVPVFYGNRCSIVEKEWRELTQRNFPSFFPIVNTKEVTS